MYVCIMCCCATHPSANCEASIVVVIGQFEGQRKTSFNIQGGMTPVLWHDSHVSTASEHLRCSKVLLVEEARKPTSHNKCNLPPTVYPSLLRDTQRRQNLRVASNQVSPSGTVVSVAEAEAKDCRKSPTLTIVIATHGCFRTASSV